MHRSNMEVATMADAPAIQRLIAESARALCVHDYTQSQVEAALGSAWGLDTQLIEDQTYFVVRSSSDVVACGGWSWRSTPFGADTYVRRDARPLQPASDPARIRAFFVSPIWVRKGLGRRLLERCESEALAHGFTRACLTATLPGVRLYSALGYATVARQPFRLPDGEPIDFVEMSKSLMSSTALAT